MRRRRDRGVAARLPGRASTPTFAQWRADAVHGARPRLRRAARARRRGPRRAAPRAHGAASVREALRRRMRRSQLTPASAAESASTAERTDRRPFAAVARARSSCERAFRRFAERAGRAARRRGRRALRVPVEVVRGVPRSRASSGSPYPGGARRRRRRHASPTRMLVEEVARVVRVVVAVRAHLAARRARRSSRTAARSSQRRVVPQVASGEWQGELLPVGARRGQRRRVDDAPGRCATATTTCCNGRKAWITQRRGLRLLHRVRQDRPRRRAPGDQRVRGGERHARASRSASSRRRWGCAARRPASSLLDDVAVPGREPHRRGGRGASRYAMGALDGSRPIVGAQARRHRAGRARRCAARYVDRARAVRRSSIADFQGVQFMLADMATQVEAARLLVYQRLRAGSTPARRDVSQASSMAKLFASDTAMSVTTDAVQLLGGAGYTRDFPVERMMRDAKVDADLRGHEPDPADRHRHAPARRGRRLIAAWTSCRARPRPLLARAHRLAPRRHRRAPRCSTGCSPATTAARSSSASRTPTGRALTRRVGRRHPGHAALARSRLGRGPGPPERALRRSTSRPPTGCSATAHAYECFCTEDEVQRAERRGDAAGPPRRATTATAATSRRTSAPRSRPRAGRASLRFRTPDEGVSTLRRPHPGRGAGRVVDDPRLRDRAVRRHADLLPRQRGRRHRRWGSPT